MTNDAKLGLVVGIGVVILIAIVFFRRDPAQPSSADLQAPAAVQPVSVASVPSVPEPLALTPFAPSTPTPISRNPAPLTPTSSRPRSR